MIIKAAPKPKVTIEGILGRGYFPPELPPPFSTRSFASLIAATKTASLPQEFTQKKNQWCDFVAYSLSRPGSLRRRLALLNPVAYYRLAKFVVDHQAELIKRATASHLSLAKPAAGIARQLKRSKRFDAVPLERAMVRMGERFLLTADVSRFYPSIYTHAIDWAISSKARAKRQLKSKGKKPTVGATLDKLVQSCQSGQTRGIPIGPAVSMLLSELLLTKVDARLKARKITHGFRYADDYELTFNERAQAERALAALEDALAEFELELNPAKTNINELPQELDNRGIQELRRFEFRTQYQAQRSDLMHFFTRAFALHKEFPDKAILRYAVSRLSPATTTGANAELLQRLILQAVSYESGVWPMAIDQLVELHRTHPLLSVADVGLTIHSMIRNYAHLNHSSEVAWSLWAGLVFAIRLTAAAVKSVVSMLDDCCCLLLFDAASRGLTAINLRQRRLRHGFHRTVYAGRTGYWRTSLLFRVGSLRQNRRTISLKMPSSSF
ncbi:MAG: RNA-directed DNA polymerase [Chthoniobacterales bacterium]|nr:RNA-directed DNA polymerase [Chthoniobacterales bacterium]